MATQLQKFSSKTTKFNGNNSNNNEVRVDFENKSVVFNPVDSHSIFYTCYDTFTTMSHVLMICSLWVTVPLFIKYEANAILGGVLFAYSIGTIFAFFPLSKTYRANWYPKMNGYMMELLCLATLMPRTWHTIKPENIDSSCIVTLPKFKNVFLKYEVTEDFSEQLKMIDIRVVKQLNKFQKISGHNAWVCEFIFKKKPTSGYLKVKYY